MQDGREKSFQVTGRASFWTDKWQALTLVSDLLISLFGEMWCSWADGSVGRVFASQVRGPGFGSSGPTYSRMWLCLSNPSAPMVRCRCIDRRILEATGQLTCTQWWTRDPVSNQADSENTRHCLLTPRGALDLNPHMRTGMCLYRPTPVTTDLKGGLH